MSKTRTPWSTSSTVSLLLAVISIAAAFLWPRPEAPPGAAPGSTARAAHAEPVATVPAEAAPAIARTLAVPLPEQGSAPPLDFTAAIDELCRLARETAALAAEDEIEQAKQLDRESRDKLAALLAAFPDAGERALADLATATGGADTAPDHTRRIVLQVVVQADLARRHQVACEVEDRASVDALTRATLATMPSSEVAAEVGLAALDRQPYLRLGHEPAVLELVRLAAADLLAREVATRLLITLWDNLAAFGERSSAELSQLALLLLDDQDPSQVVAACRQLLGDARYRPLALAWLRERHDPSLAAEVARLAAQELQPRDALQVLRELAPVLEHTRGTYLGIGVRAPDVLADAYREHLAAGDQPGVRRELVMGVGMLPQPLGLEIAELALANDPSVDVRIQAMFVFTVRGTAEQAEQAIGRVLDDPSVADDPQRLGAVVLALQNLEHGDPNVIARLGGRIGAMALPQESRRLLDELMARSLPTGAPQTGAGGG